MLSWLLKPMVPVEYSAQYLLSFIALAFCTSRELYQSSDECAMSMRIRPVGSGKTALMLALSQALRDRYSIAAVTNDIFTR